LTKKGGSKPPFSFPPVERAPAAARVALLFCALIAALPFLLPEHRAPLPSFYDEWLAVALAGCALASLGWRQRAFAVPNLSLWLAALAAWLAAQALLQPPALWQLPFAGGVYLLLAAALAFLGHALARTLGPEPVADTLASFLLVGAIANAAIGIVQFHGVPEALDGVVARTSGPRVVGHVGQGNLYADYVALGEVSLLYLYGRGRLARASLIAAATLLVVASTYSQSRTAIPFSLWIALLAWWMARGADPSWGRHARRAGFLLAATIAAIGLLPSIHESLGLRAAAFAIDRLRDASAWRAEPRPEAWLLAIRLFLDSPWLGVGWGEFAGGAFRAGLPPALAAHGVIWTSPHNVALQVLAEAGLIGAALAAAAVLIWTRDAASAARRDRSLAAWWVIAVAGVVGAHALVEYPLWYAHILGLLALCAGIVSRRSLELRRVVILAGVWPCCGLLAAVLAWTLVDYHRFEGARVIATGRTLAKPAEVGNAIDSLRATSRGPLGAKVTPWLCRSLAVDRDDLEAKLDTCARVLRYWPAPDLIARHAALLALAARRSDAIDPAARAAASYPHSQEDLSGRRR
jgi:O-antigen ligase